MRVLLVEDNAGDARLIREMLSEAGGPSLELVWAERLSGGLERLAAGGIDLVLLDLSLPDGHGRHTFQRVQAQTPQLPIIVLSGLDDALALQLVQEGAQDYLVKGQFEGNLLVRAMRYAVERKRTRKALRDSENFASSIIDQSPFSTWIADAQGTNIRQNAACRKLFGIDADEQTVGKYNLFLDPVLREQGHLDEIRKVFTEGKTVRLSVDYDFTKVGHVKVPHARHIHLDATVFPIKDAQGRVLNAVVQHEDVTERKRAEDALRASEERYRELVEDSSDMIWSLDGQGRFTYVNPAVERALGRQSEELVGGHFGKVIAPEDWEQVRTRFEEVMAGRELAREEATVVSAAGERLQVSFSARPIRGADGRPVGVRGTARDVTEERRLQERLGRAEKLAALGQMAAGIAHDFNNSLTTVLSLTQTLLLDAREEGERYSLSLIEQATRDAALIVRRLQEFAGRRQAGEDFTACDLAQMVGEALALTRPRWKNQAQGGGVTIEVATALSEAAPVRGNPAELRGVLTNLIFNAVEAMPDGGRLTISSALLPEGRVALSVGDTGLGMEAEVLRRAFDPFFTTKGPVSSGLGLSMAYGIIKRHGGDIVAESHPGQGTTFTLMLPAASMGGAQPASLEKLSGPTPPLRVLLVDDDPSVLAGTGQLLGRLGHQVESAASGEQALKLFEPGRFDLVITDLGMPGLSGWNVATRILQRSPGTPVGLLTGWSDTVEPEMAERVGIRFVLAKPFDRHELEEYLQQVSAATPLQRRRS